MSTVERPKFEPHGGRKLSDLVSRRLELSEGRGGDADDSGVEELAVAGHEFFLSLFDGTSRSTMVCSDSEALLGSLLGVGLDLRGVAGDARCERYLGTGSKKTDTARTAPL